MMNRLPISKIFKSKYCIAVFILSVIITSILIPKKIFYGYYTILGILFIFITALLITCYIRGLKEKIYSTKKNGVSLFGLIGIIFGLGALQACTIGAPICGTSIGAGLLALIFPGLGFRLLEEYSIQIFILSIILQIFAIYYMGCLKLKSNNNYNLNN